MSFDLIVFVVSIRLSKISDWPRQPISCSENNVCQNQSSYSVSPKVLHAGIYWCKFLAHCLLVWRGNFPELYYFRSQNTFLWQNIKLDDVNCLPLLAATLNPQPAVFSSWSVLFWQNMKWQTLFLNADDWWLILLVTIQSLGCFICRVTYFFPDNVCLIVYI